ncbi:MAG: hypothetical protein ABI644_14155 [Arenimonas sp.]
MKKIFLVLLASVFLLAIGPADAKSKRSQAKQLEIVQFKYSAAIRWNEFEMAWSHVDPVYRKEHPLSDLEKERLKQIQITGYEEKTLEPLEDGSIEQMVEIRLINRNTQIERIVMDTQVWRWDGVAKRWWLATGLPDFSPKSF